MKALLVIASLLLAGNAWAQDTARELDLTLPKENTPSPFTADPPGTYYGDKSGPRLPDPGARDESIDPDKAQIHGSFTTGVGYSSRGGNSNFNAANLNITKAYGENRDKKVGVSISVSQYDGPGYFGPGPYGSPYGYAAPPPFGW
jgi:hypothetical protein